MKEYVVIILDHVHSSNRLCVQGTSGKTMQKDAAQVVQKCDKCQ